MNALDVIWKNELVGRLEEYRPDMWYLEGRFVPTSGNAAAEFSRQASALDARAVFSDNARGIRCAIGKLRSADQTAVVIFSLTGGDLLLRRMMGKVETAWTVANVAE